MPRYRIEWAPDVAKSRRQLNQDAFERGQRQSLISDELEGLLEVTSGGALLIRSSDGELTRVIGPTAYTSVEASEH